MHSNIEFLGFQSLHYSAVWSECSMGATGTILRRRSIIRLHTSHTRIFGNCNWSRFRADRFLEESHRICEHKNITFL